MQNDASARIRNQLSLLRRSRHEPEARLVRQLLHPGAILVDVGANDGLYTLAGVVAGARVIAIEPQSALADRLRIRFGKSDVEVHHTAISSTPGTATLHVPIHNGRDLHSRSSLVGDANPGFDTREVEVRTERLDDLTTNADVLKIDVEGFECAVLESASALLAKSRPIVLVEVERRHHPGEPFDALRILKDAGYSGWFLKRRKFTPLAQFDPDRHQPLGGIKDPDSISRPVGFVNNFILFHPATPIPNRHRLTVHGWLLPSDEDIAGRAGGTGSLFE